MHRHRADTIAMASLILFIAWCHWQELLGIAQPVGGDKTNFTYGLMAHYDTCLSQGRLPFWNELWGFGFPGVAESQIGAFYPIHLLFYGLLAPLTAFRWCFLLHRFLAVVVCFFSLRQMGLRTRGAWLGTLVHVGGGFAVGHWDHQWAIEAMVWTPAVFACTHCWIQNGSRTACLLLPVFIALQLVIGHFQVAFMTVVACTLYGLLLGLSNGPAGWKRLAIWLSTTALGFGLAAAQLWPTAEFARYVRSVNPVGTTVEFHSTHACPPWLSSNLAFPYVYFRDPLWREVFWTPQQTSPEECLAYVGLVPLCLAMGVCWRWRRRPVIRHWTLVGIFAMFLSWSPFLPGFEYLVGLPGFSFFRSWARWGLIVQFQLALIAGWGFDHVHSSRRLWRWWFRFVLPVLLTATVIAGFWLLLGDYGLRGGRSFPVIAGTIEKSPSLQTIAREMVTRRMWDAYTEKYWLALDRPAVPTRLVDVWAEVWWNEVWPSVAMFLAFTVVLLALSRWCHRRKLALTLGVSLLCLIDLGVLSRLVPNTVAPLSQLQEPSPVVEAFRQLEGSRVIAPGGNLLQTWGLAPVQAYRTLDIPVPTGVSQALNMPGRVDWNKAPFALLGLNAIVDYPAVDSQTVDNTTVFTGETLDWWLYGNQKLRSVLQKRGRSMTCTVRPIKLGTSSSLLIPLPKGEADLDLWDPAIFSVEQAGVAQVGTRTPTIRTWQVTTFEPVFFVVGEMYSPGWTARTEGGKELEVERIDDYWQAVRLTEVGTHTIVFDYSPPGWRKGMVLSSACLAFWLGLVLLVLSRWKLNR